MENVLKGRSLLTLRDFSQEEILYLLTLAKDLKQKKKAGIFEKNLLGRNIALIFEKPSTRTRCAFTVACVDEGAHPEYLGQNDLQLGHKESVEDTARVLGRMFDGIEFRGYKQHTVEVLAKYSGVPVWNGLTDDDHPTQALGDLMTIDERFGQLNGIRVAYIGDGRNNVANALLIAASKTGMDFTICAPPSLFPKQTLVKECCAFAGDSGGTVTILSDPKEAVRGADVIYTDVWVSMGEETGVTSERVALLEPYRVTSELMSATGKPETVFMHCLPAVHDMEVMEEVFESSASLVFDEAENRMHTIKAVMVATIAVPAHKTIF
ncbi:MAG: ornithine carbamoyltransferase [Clostridiales bacterium]|nr:ornithine carbamoyltransferase [Clostridiales bacterium]